MQNTGMSSRIGFNSLRMASISAPTSVALNFPSFFGRFFIKDIITEGHFAVKRKIKEIASLVAPLLPRNDTRLSLRAKPHLSLRAPIYRGEAILGGYMMLRTLDIFQDIAAEFSKVFEALEMFVDFRRVNFDIFMDEQISQACHRCNLFCEIFRYNVISSQDKNRVFIIMSSVPAILCNQMMGNVEEGLYDYL